MNNECKEAMYQFFLESGAIANRKDEIIFEAGWIAALDALKVQLTKQEGA